MATSTHSRSVPNRIKRMVAYGFDAVGLNALGFWLQRIIYGQFIRAVNYHAIATDDASNFERQLEYFARRYASVTHKQLDNFLKNGEWTSDRPGLVLCFDDGHRSHAEIAAPLLEKYGFTGWFCVPVGQMRLEENVPEAISSQGLHKEQLEMLSGRHVIVSHSETHCRLGANVGGARLEVEIAGSRHHLERVLGSTVDAFCWVGGEERSYSKAAAEVIRANYNLSFMTNSAVITPGTDPLQLQRTNIEAGDPLWLVRFQLSGLMDIYYYFKRRRVNRLTA